MKDTLKRLFFYYIDPNTQSLPFQAFLNMMESVNLLNTSFESVTLSQKRLEIILKKESKMFSDNDVWYSSACTPRNRESVKGTVFNIDIKVFFNVLLRISQYIYQGMRTRDSLTHLIEDYIQPWLTRIDEEINLLWQTPTNRIIPIELLENQIYFESVLSQLRVDKRVQKYFRQVMPTVELIH